MLLRSEFNMLLVNLDHFMLVLLVIVNTNAFKDTIIRTLDIDNKNNLIQR